jgi:hypothetical protein
MEYSHGCVVATATLANTSCFATASILSPALGCVSIWDEVRQEYGQMSVRFLEIYNTEQGKMRQSPAMNVTDDQTIGNDYRGRTGSKKPSNP